MKREDQNPDRLLGFSALVLHWTLKIGGFFAGTVIAQSITGNRGHGIQVGDAAGIAVTTAALLYLYERYASKRDEKQNLNSDSTTPPGPKPK